MEGINRVINTFSEFVQGNKLESKSETPSSQVLRSIMKPFQIEKGTIKNDNVRFAANGTILAALGFGLVGINLCTGGLAAPIAMGVIAANALFNVKASNKKIETSGPVNYNSALRQLEEKVDGFKTKGFSNEEIFKEIKSMKDEILKLTSSFDPKDPAKISGDKIYEVKDKIIDTLPKKIGLTPRETKIREDLINNLINVSTIIVIKKSEPILNGFIKFSDEKKNEMLNLFNKFSTTDRHDGESGEKKLLSNSFYVGLDTFTLAETQVKDVLANNKEVSEGAPIQLKHTPINVNTVINTMVTCAKMLSNHIGPGDSRQEIAKEQYKILKDNTAEGAIKNFTEIANAVQILSDLANEVMEPKAEINSAEQSDSDPLSTSASPAGFKGLDNIEKGDHPESESKTPISPKLQDQNVAKANISPQFKRPAPKFDGKQTGLPDLLNNNYNQPESKSEAPISPKLQDPNIAKAEFNSAEQSDSVPLSTSPSAAGFKVLDDIEKGDKEINDHIKQLLSSGEYDNLSEEAKEQLNANYKNLSYEEVAILKNGSDGEKLTKTIYPLLYKGVDWTKNASE